MPERLFNDVLAAWNSHDGRRLANLMADDGIYEDVAVGRVMDPAAVVDFVARTHTLSSDYKIEWVSTQRNGSRYATEWLMSGTNDGPAPELGLPPTGKRWEIRGASVGVLDDDGHIKLHRDYWNLAGFLIQLGVLPPPSPQ
jgi:steroid delta-isomerase-like uncharacterized protein